jgi:hypothetical protein
MNVRGKSAAEVRSQIAEIYVKLGVLRNDARILVSIARRRTYRVTVVHGVNSYDVKALDLSAYENDVLTALAQSGGVTSVERGIVVIQRGSAAPGTAAGTVIGGIEQIRIPLYIRTDQPLPFKPEDVILKNGDVITFEFSPAQSSVRLVTNPAERPVGVTMAVAAPDGRILVQVPGGTWKMCEATKVTATETNGTPVVAIAERLKTMTTVLVAADGKPPTEQYLQLAKPGTLVLILKD